MLRRTDVQESKCVEWEHKFTKKHFALVQALSGLCKCGDKDELDMKIWRKTDASADSFLGGGGLDAATARATVDSSLEEEAAEAVLTAVFLTSESVSLLATKISFAIETADLQLRLVVNSEPNNIGERQ